MPWFRVDDGFHAHKKAVRAGVEALGLWLLAGSWSADQLTDGWVPDYMAARMDPNYEENAKRLVSVGLWTEDNRDGEQGWSFHQWEEHQPSSESVIAKRDAARERMKELREQRRLRSQGVRANIERSSQEVRSAPTRPDPTRPDPEEKKTSSSSQPRERGTRIPADFVVTDEMAAWGRKNAPDVDGQYETAQFIDYWSSRSGKDATKTDWTATWRTWIRRAQRDTATNSRPKRPEAPQIPPRATERCGNCQGRKFLEHPGTGLPAGRCPDCNPERASA